MKKYSSYLIVLSICSLSITFARNEVYGEQVVDQTDQVLGEIRLSTDSLPQNPSETVFMDDFNSVPGGEPIRNMISDPEPIGLGYPTDVPYGYPLEKWIIDDASPDNRRSFWCIPQGEDGTIETYAQQVGRSKNSVAYAEIPLPREASHYIIEFRQWCNDNDYIGYIIGASKPTEVHDGAEFGYIRQIPGTDNTVEDAYLSGDLGEKKIDGQALMRQWVQHRIEVKDKEIRWFQNDRLMVSKIVSHLTPDGYFGIRQRFERGTRYDDVEIKLIK